MQRLEKDKNFEEIQMKNPKVVQDKLYTQEKEIEAEMVKMMLEKRL